MERLNKALVPQVKRPQNIRVMQFGEGGFLRAFVDEMLDNLNTQCGGDYGVAIVQPLERGMCKMLEEQDCLYTVMLRGREESGDVKKVKVVGTVLKTIEPYADFQSYLDLAKVDKSMGLVVCLHQPIVRNTESSDVLKVISTCENYQAIANACAGFPKVEIFTGHSHFAAVVNWSSRFTETVHPSVCGVWWLSKSCHDGTPAAYTLYEVDGTEMRRSLMAYDYPAHPQVFAHQTDVTDPDGKPAIQFNVPFYGDGWTVRVTENGEEVAQARRIHSSDWYYEHTEFPAQPAFQQKYATVQPRKTWHIFYYTPVNASASVQLEVRDPWGRKGLVYAL